MLSHKENELLTRVGPEAPMGKLMRRYWVPALFQEHLPKPDCPPVRVRLLRENLVAFRDSEGRIGMLDERCPHRTASLFFGRNEERGLRCVYHGWKFDVDGKCVDMPSEPEGSAFEHKVRTKSYPCLERGGVIWAYMGPPELKPEFPDLEWTQVPRPNRFVTRHIQECNWLQGVEGGFDASHLAFLHRGTAHGAVKVVPRRYEVIPMDFGFVVGSGRDIGDGVTQWSANVMLMPFHKVITQQPFGAHVWVPIDDESTMVYSIDYWVDRPLTDQDLERSKSFQHIHAENTPGTDLAVRNKSNDYLIDRDLQASGQSFTGMRGLAIQDCAIQESMGPIADRTVEHLGVSDTAIIKLRSLLIDTVRRVEHGGTPPGVDGKGYRVRSSRFDLPVDTDFAKALPEHLGVYDTRATVKIGGS